MVREDRERLAISLRDLVRENRERLVKSLHDWVKKERIQRKQNDISFLVASSPKRDF